MTEHERMGEAPEVICQVCDRGTLEPQPIARFGLIACVFGYASFIAGIVLVCLALFYVRVVEPGVPDPPMIEGMPAAISEESSFKVRYLGILSTVGWVVSGCLAAGIGAALTSTERGLSCTQCGAWIRAGKQPAAAR